MPDEMAVWEATLISEGRLLHDRRAREDPFLETLVRIRTSDMILAAEKQAEYLSSTPAISPDVRKEFDSEINSGGVGYKRDHAKKGRSATKRGVKKQAKKPMNASRKRKPNS